MSEASGRQEADILIAGGCLVTMNPTRDVFLDGAIAIKGDMIVAAGSRQDVTSSFHATKSIDATGCAVLPGFVNAHTHAFQTLYRGLGDDMEVLEWVQRMIFPLSRALQPNEAGIGTRLACLEMIKSGITTFADSFYVHHDKEAIDRVADAIAGSGLRAVLARACSDTGERPEDFKETITEACDETERAMKAWGGQANGRLMVCPEALFTLFATPELIVALRELAFRFNTGFHMHAGESIDEAKEIQRRTGKSIFSYLHSINALGPGVLAHHAIWCTDTDISILAETGTAISHNPISNQYLAAGVAPIARMLDRGVVVALGTDGAASNNSQDYFQSLKGAVLLQKVSNLDPNCMNAELVLTMATLNGASALGLADLVGSIEPRKRADVTIVSLRRPNAVPAHKPVSTLVYASRAADVQTLIVDGRLVMEDRQVLTMDEDSVIAEATAAGARLVASSRSEHLLGTGRFNYFAPAN